LKGLIWDIRKGYVEGTAYNAGKIRAREQAEEWQNDFYNHDYSWSELLEFQEIFARLAKRYGLTREFRENGII